ncbi:alpha/beta hydrolase domain-containing protein [Burkholderia sp. IMCC1007]|uniref:alpha/beta hydrolase domain-containing protein n=1 Tax=Burkholderia sp. IMCC1007 TaxID=3004104 RepID=UPI0022B4D99E|nr:alpha/beta hydrolase domain-containing protein [Burkholderia sp. IMCC1007]
MKAENFQRGGLTSVTIAASRGLLASCIFVLLGLGGCGSDSNPQSSQQTATNQQTVPIPTAQLIPRTATSIPWNANDKKLTPIYLSDEGYVEEEYFISGAANIYDWPDTKSSAVVKTANVPYVTQFIVTRPADMSRFSGNVLVEVGNPTSGYDKPNFWSTAHKQVIRNGDAFIEMASQSGSIAKLKQYDPVRYGPLNWASPSAPTSMENGLYWDMLSQAAAWVRSNASTNPLNGKVKTVIAVGVSQSSVMLNTYLNAVLPLARKEDGKPMFDGILQTIGPNYFPINGSASAPYSFASRGIVPTIRIASSADFANMMGPADNPPPSSRRADSDAPGDQYRLYEIAGMPHNSIWMNIYSPGWGQVAKIGVTPTPALLSDITFTPSTNDFPGWAFYHAALVNLENWINNGIAPPKDLPRITYQAMHGSEHIEYQEDAYGNTVGGIRNPWVDVPYATWVPHSYNNPEYTGSSQFTRNYKIPFSVAQLTNLYGNSATFLSKFDAGIDALVSSRMILDVDAEVLKDQVFEMQLLNN